MSKSDWVIEVTDDTFEEDVIVRSNQVPVVLDFWAEWCPPCKALGPILEALAEEYSGRFILAKADTEKNPRRAQEFGVSSIPMVIAFSGGRSVHQFLGLLPEPHVRDFLKQIIPSDADILIRKADELKPTNAEAARKLFEEALALEPSHAVALAGLAELHLQAGEAKRAHELAESVSESSDGWDRAQNVISQLAFRQFVDENVSLDDLRSRSAANPDDLTARFNLGMAQAAEGDFSEALETLVSIAERDPGFGNEHVKDQVVKIFSIIGPQSETSNRFRSRLTMALY